MVRFDPRSARLIRKGLALFDMGDQGHCKELQRLLERLAEAVAEVKQYSPKRTGKHWSRAAEGLAGARNEERSAMLDLREHISQHGCDGSTGNGRTDPGADS